MFATCKSRLKQREVKSVQDFIDGETLAEARRGDSSDLRLCYDMEKCYDMDASSD